MESYRRSVQSAKHEYTMIGELWISVQGERYATFIWEFINILKPISSTFFLKDVLYRLVFRKKNLL